MTKIHIIPEVIAEVLTTIAEHYGATFKETQTAYFLDIGNVRSQVQQLYAATIASLHGSVASA